MLPMKKTGFSLWVKVVFAATLLVIVTLGVATYRNTTMLLATERLVARTHHAREVAASTLSSLRDAETNQRGFLLTGEDQYLAPYNRSFAIAKAKLTELRDLTSEDRVLQRQLDRLENLIATRLEHLQEAVALRQRSSGEEGIRALANCCSIAAAARWRRTSVRCSPRLVSIRTSS